MHTPYSQEGGSTDFVLELRLVLKSDVGTERGAR